VCVTATQDQQARTRPGRKTTTARRPRLALDLARAAGAVRVLPELVDLPNVSVASCSDAVETALMGRPAPENENDPAAVVWTNRAAVVNALLDHAHLSALAELATAEAALAARCDLLGRSFRSEASQLLALRRAGIRLERLDDEALRPFRRRRVVADLQRVRRAMHLEHWVRTGSVRQALAAAYDHAMPTGADADRSLAATSAALAAEGVDGERLTNAMVYFEAGRHLGLVKQQANRMSQSYTGYSAEDLFGWGWKGLIVALRGYDPTASAFSTYACTRIVGHIQDGVRAESPIPKRLGTFSRKAAVTEETLAGELGRPPTQEETAAALCRARLVRELGRTPTIAEVAAKAHEDLAQLKLRPRLAIPATIDETSGPEGAGVVLAALGPDPADVAMSAVLRDEIEAALAALPTDESEAVRLLDYEGVSYDEARERTGASRRQLHQRRARGRERLAEALAPWA
jgi:RNA polymerase sigma factor FliA